MASEGDLSCEVIRGTLGARKNPTKLAKRMGVKGAKLVSLERSKVVLIGVRVTEAFSAAIVQIIAKAGLIPGIKAAVALPRQAPVKKMGIINPPRQPPVTVRLIVAILANAKPNRKRTGKEPSRTASNSWWPK